MISHTAEGSFGLVINRPTGVRATALIPGARDFVYCGGPVEPKELLFLHRMGEDVPGARVVSSGVYFGSDLEQLRYALEEAPAGETRWRIYMGYSGWGRDQLEGELATGGWLVCPGGAKYVFDLPAARLWQQVLLDQGDEYRYLTTMPLDPGLN